MSIAEIHALFLRCGSVTTDTRKIVPACLFVALKGERFDGNAFAAEALDSGASYVLIDNPDCYIDHRTLLVEDTLKALQELARYHRQYLKLPIIALTGSNGKTTTKELIHAVLSKQYTTKATVGNLNNHIGVPLTLLSFDAQTEIGIVEMGANHQQEIAFLCSIALPDYGYITNFGKAHLEGFGGVEGVIKGKSEMYDYLRQNGKTVFVNLDDALQREKTADMPRVTFSRTDATAYLYITKAEADPLVKITFGGHLIKSHLIGLYNANNINVAVLVGKHFNVPENDIKSAIEAYVPENNRSQLLKKGSNEIILDAYNANPSSMKVALDNFLQLEQPDKTLIIGDMFELGAESLAEHAAIVQLLEGQSAVQCYFVGEDFYQNRSEKPHFNFFKNFEDFSTYFKNHLPMQHLILIKGSRGMALERTLDLL